MTVNGVESTKNKEQRQRFERTLATGTKKSDPKWEAFEIEKGNTAEARRAQTLDNHKGNVVTRF